MKPWDNIVLTDEEREAAIIEGKKRKYFHEKNKGSWEAQDKPKYVRETKIKVGKLIIDKTLPKIFPE